MTPGFRNFLNMRKRQLPPKMYRQLYGHLEPIRGLGDVIERITYYTGIKWLTGKYAKITGKPCGCEKRKALLNKLIPIK